MTRVKHSFAALHTACYTSGSYKAQGKKSHGGSYPLRCPTLSGAWCEGVNCTMDARNIRIGETGVDELIQWLRQTGQPQPLEILTERYLAILKRALGVEESS